MGDRVVMERRLRALQGFDHRAQRERASGCWIDAELSVPGPFGAAEAPLAIPAAPRLAGASLAAQAVVLSPGGSLFDVRLANASVLVILR